VGGDAVLMVICRPLLIQKKKMNGFSSKTFKLNEFK
jgi:hypothetical protein